MNVSAPAAIPQEEDEEVDVKEEDGVAVEGNVDQKDDDAAGVASAAMDVDSRVEKRIHEPWPRRNRHKPRIHEPWPRRNRHKPRKANDQSAADNEGPSQNTEPLIDLKEGGVCVLFVVCIFLVTF